MKIRYLSIHLSTILIVMLAFVMDFAAAENRDFVSGGLYGGNCADVFVDFQLNTTFANVGLNPPQLWRSENWGDSWTVSSEDVRKVLGYDNTTGLSWISTPMNILYSNDSGLSWSEISSPLGDFTGCVCGGMVYIVGKGELNIGLDNNAVYVSRSANMGETWNHTIITALGSEANSNQMGCFVDPQIPTERVFVYEKRNVIVAGEVPASSNDISFTTLISDGNIGSITVAIGSSGDTDVYIQKSGGSGNMVRVRMTNSSGIHTTLSSSPNCETLSVNMFYTPWRVICSQYYSDDDGNTWPAYPDPFFGRNGVTFMEKNVVFRGTDTGVFSEIIAGGFGTWVRKVNGIEAIDVFGMSINSSNIRDACVATNAGAYRSVDFSGLGYSNWYILDQVTYDIPAYGDCEYNNELGQIETMSENGVLYSFVPGDISIPNNGTYDRVRRFLSVCATSLPLILFKIQQDISFDSITLPETRNFPYMAVDDATGTTIVAMYGWANSDPATTLDGGVFFKQNGGSWSTLTRGSATFSVFVYKGYLYYGQKAGTAGLYKVALPLSGSSTPTAVSTVTGSVVSMDAYGDIMIVGTGYSRYLKSSGNAWSDDLDIEQGKIFLSTDSGATFKEITPQNIVHPEMIDQNVPPFRAVAIKKNDFTTFWAGMNDFFCVTNSNGVEWGCINSYNQQDVRNATGLSELFMRTLISAVNVLKFYGNSTSLLTPTGSSGGSTPTPAEEESTFSTMGSSRGVQVGGLLGYAVGLIGKLNIIDPFDPNLLGKLPENPTSIIAVSTVGGVFGALGIAGWLLDRKKRKNGVRKVSIESGTETTERPNCCSKWWSLVKTFGRHHSYVAVMMGLEGNYTRPRRAAVLLFFLLGELWINALFWYAGSSNIGDYIMTGIISCSIMIIPSFILGFLFKRTPIKKSLANPNSDEYELKEVKEELRRKKHRKMLPWWFIFIDWLVAVGFIGFTGYIVVVYGLAFGTATSLNWLLSGAVSLAQDVFVNEPVKILLAATFGTLGGKAVEKFVRNLLGDTDSQL